MTDITETRDLDTCRALRRTVFIEEQNVPEEEEWDGLDADAVHLLARVDGHPVGTARLLLKGETGKIGRVCVLREARGTGLGAALIREGEARLRALGCTRAQLGAQCHAIPFYEKLGFSAYGPIYDDAGIPHRDMEKPL
ncbi:GNAT family N-acetyltransferase [Pseudothioclava nitratireducens]|jgi:ElaA protein|uniref:GNAT family N-acetyltransferase n=1 Tax=Pseudothioclava nitratireducens TaxID=1928646 RepID=UPI0023D9B4FC|nr:GNAT family N-acetyltransferase [Defluviimonas nitratireducens]MDF1621662.1 GNAT family N-acetyltransferase [Defluviimonas nitratireducens]